MNYQLAALYEYADSLAICDQIAKLQSYEIVELAEQVQAFILGGLKPSEAVWLALV
jgi:hypothetical protein